MNRSDRLVALDMAPPGPILGRSPQDEGDDDDDDDDDDATDGAGKHHARNRPIEVLIFIVLDTSFSKQECR